MSKFFKNKPIKEKSFDEVWYVYDGETDEDLREYSNEEDARASLTEEEKNRGFYVDGYRFYDM